MMDARFRDRLYSRLIELTKHDEGRFMIHLAEEQAPNVKRQARFTASKQAAGYRRIPVWIHDDDLQTLKKRFPGERGGVDWQSVIKAINAGGQDQVYRDRPGDRGKDL